MLQYVVLHCRPVAILMGEGGICRKVDLFRHHYHVQALKVLGHWGIQGMIPPGKVCNHGPQESAFPALYAWSLMNKITNVDHQLSLGWC